MCGKKYTPTSYNQAYCGSQKKKTGCSYRRMLKIIRRWNDEHVEQLKPLRRRAYMKYYVKNRRVKLAYQKAYNHARRYLKLIYQ